uniref:CN hydrolase domain-containing protein n=1 Tax=Cyclophora tenuis TaxID=216820 RepID=A0A6U1Q2M7_CYCTE
MEQANPIPSTNAPDAPRKLVVSAIQLTAIGTPQNDIEGFWNRAVDAVRESAAQGATLILLPELFLGPYFCQSQEASLMAFAKEVDECFIVREMQYLAKELGVVLPVSLYERKQNALYNSIVMIDADGTILGTYRKSHIPDGTGYQEKFYFTPGDTGFRVWNTKIGKVGVAICWDQWFPEAARAMALQGADVILYPTAIGSEPQDPTLNSRDHWQRVMQGHSAANMVPVVASNRYGTEILQNEDGTEKQRIHFYGRSFITDETGKIVKEAKDGRDILVYEVNTEENRATRLAWGLFRDRRPELYKVLLTKDGVV